MRTTLREFCAARDHPQLLAQWDRERNQPLTPEDVTYGSRRKVWWRCDRGHEWQAAVYARVGGAGCPYCSGRRVAPGQNDLASREPRLATEWHPEKNGPLAPQDVSCGSHKAVWWLCSKGHVWQAGIKSRVAGAGCPVCANRTPMAGENDLASTHPALAAEWHPEKNGTLTPQDVTYGSRRRVWWRCGRGHEWRAAVSSRTAGAGCPVCTGRRVEPGENDLASAYPAVARQWHPGRNGALTAAHVSPYSNRRVWWLCPRGHAYQAGISARTMNGTGCPYCTGRRVLAGFNDLATRQPVLAGQWQAALNAPLTPQMVTPGSHKKVWWQCADGHVWMAAVHSRAGPQKCGCPVCAGRGARPRGGYPMPAGAGKNTLDFHGGKST